MIIALVGTDEGVEQDPYNEVPQLVGFSKPPVASLVVSPAACCGKQGTLCSSVRLARSSMLDAANH